MLFPGWWYLLSVIILTFVGSFLGSYFKRKGENLATKEDYESLLEQVKETTSATENIKINLARGNWLHQRSWYLKEKYYTGLLEALYELELSLSNRLDLYNEGDYQHADHLILNNPDYKKHSKTGRNAFKKLQNLQGPSEIVVSNKAIKALKNFYSKNWEVSHFTTFTEEYLDTLHASVKSTRKIVLEEARSDLVGGRHLIEI